MSDDVAPGTDEAPPSALRRVLRSVVELAGLLLLGLVLMVVVGQLRAPDLPDQAPDFELLDLDGKTVRLSDLRGAPVVLNFWATWCGPCRVEIPAFSSYADAHPDIVVLGIATDGAAPELRAAARKLDIRYPVLVGDDRTVAAYGVDTLPTTVVVDAEGNISSAHAGLMLQPQLWLSVLLARM